MTRRALSVLLIFVLAASTQACGQSSDTANTPPPAETAAPSTPAPAAVPTPAPVPAASPAAAPSTPPTTTNAAGTTENKKIYCPAVSKLKKINMFWGAAGGWRSYSESFVNVIDSFAGAQWVGVNVGKMLCVYKSKSTFEFPVVLQNDTLTPVPEGVKWIKKANNAGIASEGIINCISNDILECPFKFEEEKANVKDDLDFFKGKKDYLEDGSVKP